MGGAIGCFDRPDPPKSPLKRGTKKWFRYCYFCLNLYSFSFYLQFPLFKGARGIGIKLRI